ncbi:hypothetical protein B9N43_05625 [Denitratisoma sp. DHT3]|uniref:excisionase n=1 Tax=Denitratisoma sp. DHT3 TaxID=1981880 RepID=UPI0011984833|nr:excisionase [Denitratisoma sp. DHT3]QDX82861.1 hypothetical protein B9N43_05625 [Denitratisoma sp. DHT3]
MKNDYSIKNEVPAQSTLLSTRYVRLKLFSELTGYSVKALQRKIEDGIWREGQEYLRGPDGRILVDVLGYDKWVQS